MIRVSGNSELINEDIDISAAGIMDGTSGIDEVSQNIVSAVIRTASGEPTAVEGLGDATMTLYQKDQRVENLLGLTSARCCH